MSIIKLLYSFEYRKIPPIYSLWRCLLYRSRKVGMCNGHFWTLNAPHSLTHSYLAHRHKKILRRWSKIRATYTRCVLFDFTTSYHDSYCPKCQFCSQRVQNGHFFNTHVENQAVPRILVNPWKTIKYHSLLKYSAKIAFVRSNLANLSKICFKHEVMLVQNL